MSGIVNGKLVDLRFKKNKDAWSKGLDAKKRATKHDAGKPMVELVDPSFILGVASVLTHGAKKYEPNNWRKGLPWTRIYASTLRHLLLWATGEDKDKDSGLSHLSHAATNLMFLITWARTHKELDDRVKL